MSLNLSVGKLAAQAAHASIAAFLKTGTEDQLTWMENGMPKIILAAGSELDILMIEKKAKNTLMPVAVIRDAGKTELPAGTVTCLGIGPGPILDIDKLTGKLRLL